MSTGVKFDERATCRRCGRFGAYLFDGARLCGDCYEQHGSCCPEFGGATDEDRSAPECRNEHAPGQSKRVNFAAGARTSSASAAG